MQNIQKHPMVSVKEAAQAFGIDERTVREKLSSQEWKGEKKSIGLKEKWFLHRGEFERQLARLGLSKPVDRVNVQDIDTVFNTDLIDAEFAESSAENQAQNIHSPEQLEKIVKTITTSITQPLMEELSKQRDMIIALTSEVKEKDNQLRLLPDLQKEVNDKHFELEYYRKRTQELEAQLKLSWWDRFLKRSIQPIKQ